MSVLKLEKKGLRIANPIFIFRGEKNWVNKDAHISLRCRLTGFWFVLSDEEDSFWPRVWLKLLCSFVSWSLSKLYSKPQRVSKTNLNKIKLMKKQRPCRMGLCSYVCWFFSQGLGLMSPKLGICFTSPKQISVGDEISPIAPQNECFFFGKIWL